MAPGRRCTEALAAWRQVRCVIANGFTCAHNDCNPKTLMEMQAPHFDPMRVLVSTHRGKLPTRLCHVAMLRAGMPWRFRVVGL